MTHAIDLQTKRFTSDFSSALANVLSQFTAAAWTVQETPEAGTAGKRGLRRCIDWCLGVP